MECRHCHQPLNKSIFKRQRTLKSCPNCSANNGSEHIFYPYPDAFGTTPRRSSASNPDGPQSHCTACRGGSDQHDFAGFKCSEV